MTNEKDSRLRTKRQSLCGNVALVFGHLERRDYIGLANILEAEGELLEAAMIYAVGAAYYDGDLAKKCREKYVELTKRAVDE